MLQFADDTLLVGEGNWKHVRAISIVLRAFELVSGLGINYHKSKLIGINTNPHFLEAVSFYLSCRLEDSNFYFLGIPIGFNPRKVSTWKPLVTKVRHRLDGWTNRFLNLGGRITLLKSVLSAICIFTMSFYRMPKKVVQILTSAFRNFLWGGVDNKRHIPWIKWGVVTLPLDKGGLGVKDLDLFNKALINKWRWRILQGSKSLWFDILKARYGDICLQAFGPGVKVKASQPCSWWWKDILNIFTSSSTPSSSDIAMVTSSLDPIVKGCKFVIRNGFHTSFWHAAWLDDLSLCELFPNLYAASALKDVSVAAMGGWMEGTWRWGDLGISVSLLVDRVSFAQYDSLKGCLGRFEGWRDGTDSVVWMGNGDRRFSVASCYDMYERARIPFGPSIRYGEVFGILWDSVLPFKIKAFGWRLFHDRLPLKNLLVERGMRLPLANLFCSFCGIDMEDRNHLFFGCWVVKNIWKEVATWVGKGDFF